MSEPTIDNAHAKLIAEASTAIKADKELLSEARYQVTIAKGRLKASLDRLQKLAAEVADKGLWQGGA